MIIVMDGLQYTLKRAETDGEAHVGLAGGHAHVVPYKAGQFVALPYGERPADRDPKIFVVDSLEALTTPFEFVEQDDVEDPIWPTEHHDPHEHHRLDDDGAPPPPEKDAP